jgi:hypothetical protein
LGLGALAVSVGEHGTHIAEAATSLRVSDVTGALSGLDGCRDAIQDAIPADASWLIFDRTNGMPKAVTNQRVAVICVLLEDALT